MSQRRLALAVLVLTGAGARFASAQTSTFHLHKEASTTAGVFQLKTAGPDAAKTAVTTIDLKNRPIGEYVIKQFDTQPGALGAAGAIPSGSALSFTLWMKQSSNFGTMQPRVRVRLNAAAGALLCQATGAANLTTSLTAYALSCAIGASVVVTSADRLYVWVGVNLTAAPGNHGAGGELDIEGTLNGNYDSRLTVPLPLPPSIVTLTPSAGAPTASLSIAGANFGNTQGTSTVTFNGTASAPTSWSATSITTAVPMAATTGPVVVTVGGAASNGIVFTVLPPLLSTLAPASGHVGDAITITGARFLATQGSSTVRFNGTAASPTSWSDSTIVVPVPAGAGSGDVVVTVAGRASSGLPFSVITPGSIRGAVTRAGDATGVAGAAIQAASMGRSAGAATTAADGGYAIDGLDAGTYDIRVSSPGFASEIRRGIAVSSGMPSTVNVAMSVPGVVSGSVTTADGTAPLSGAAVTIYAGGLSEGSTNTNESGAYALGSLHPGSYTAQASAVGYQSSVIEVSVAENSTSLANFRLVAAPGGPVSYAYDALGRLIQVTDASGDSAIYRYDAVGNLVAIERPGTNGSGPVAISGLAPSRGPAGTAVTISGAGFSSTAAENAVTFNGAAAEVANASPTVVVASVPSGASSGPVAVSNARGSATSAIPFLVTADTGRPTITSVDPTIGAAGTPLTITGTNFDSTLGNNRVTLNTTWQPALSSGNTSSLLLTVPGAAMGGHIAVETPLGRVVTASDFFVPPAPHVASDVALADRISIGSSKNVSVATAGKIALLLFDGTAGQSISLRASNVAFTGDCITGSYAISILKPNASILASADRGCSNGLFIDQTMLPTSGAYTVLLDPILSNTGSLTITLYDVVDVAGPIAADGTSVPIVIATPGQNAGLTFPATAGQVVSATATSSSWTSCQFGGQYSLGMLRPDRTSQVTISNACGSTTLIDHQTLPVSGTYTLWLDPYGANTGSATLAVHTIVDVMGPIVADGTSAPLVITAPGQNARLTFEGTAGQVVGGWASAAFWSCTAVTFSISIVKPDGSTLKSTGNQCATAATDQVTLPVDGTYTFVFDPAGTHTGTATLRLFTVVDAVGPITVNGPSVPVSITTPFQNGRLTFDGTAGQVVTASATSSTWTGCVTLQFDLYLLRPDGSTLASMFGCWGSAVISQRTLPTSGTYTIRLDPRDTNVGSAAVSLTSP